MSRINTWLAAASLALLTACGQGGGATVSGPIGGDSGTELADEQVLHWGNGGDPATLDPHKAEGVPSSNIGRDLFEGLVSEAPNGDLIPGAAQSWEISEDGKTYTFFLRRDARWSNGDPVVAGDFVFSLRRSLDPATRSAYRFILYPILNAEAVGAGELDPSEVGVAALDDHTLRIELENPTPYFLGLLTHSASYPVHPATVAAHGERYTRPGNLVSNGAYMLQDWVVQSHVKLVRNPHYWDAAAVVIEEVYYHTTEDQSAELKRYRAGELDITYTSLPQSQLAWIRENLSDELVVAPYLGTFFYGFNLTRPPFKDKPALRRALALAIDRDIITKEVMQAGQIPAFGWVPPVANYDPQEMPEAKWSQAEREQEAQRLYAQAGYSDANPLRVEFMYNTEENWKNLAVATAAMWKRVLGVETSLVNQEWKVFLETRKQKVQTQVFRDAWVGDYNDAYTFAELLLTSSGLNTYGYANAQYDELLRRASAEADLAKRAGYLEQAERLMLEDMPIMPIYFYVNARLVKPWVAGYESNIMDHHRSKNLAILEH